MCCIVQGMCLKPLLAVTVIHCWSSGFLTTSVPLGAQSGSLGPTAPVLDHQQCTGGGRQHRWVGWMSGNEGGWVERGWDAYGPRSRGAV